MNSETREIEFTLDSGEGMAAAVKQVKDLYEDLENAKSGGFYLKGSAGKVKITLKRETHKKPEQVNRSGGKD